MKMEELLIDKLYTSGMLYFYLVSLISADSLLTVKNCETSIERLKSLMNEIPSSKLTDEEKEKIEKYCIKGIEICENDKKTLENKNIN